MVVNGGYGAIKPPLVVDARHRPPWPVPRSLESCWSQWPGLGCATGLTPGQGVSNREPPRMVGLLLKIDINDS